MAQKYCYCMYDLDGNFIAKRCFSCKGCCKKRMPKNTPACIRIDHEKGEIVFQNKYFKDIKHKVKE